MKLKAVLVPIALSMVMAMSASACGEKKETEPSENVEAQAEATTEAATKTDKAILDGYYAKVEEINTIGGDFMAKMQEMLQAGDPAAVPQYAQELKAIIARCDDFINLTDVPEEYAEVHKTLKEDVEAFKNITNTYIDDLVRIADGELDADGDVVQNDIKQFQDTANKMSESMTAAKNVHDGLQ